MKAVCFPVYFNNRTLLNANTSSHSGHVWTAPAVQEESDISAKRSGAAMYPACFRLEDCLRHDAAAMAAGPDVIRGSVPTKTTRSFLASAQNGFSDRRSRPFRINVVITPAVRERTDATSSFHRQSP